VSREVAALLMGIAASGCDAVPPSLGGSDAGASPNASILPAPLATEPTDLTDGSSDDDAGSRAIVPDGPGHPVAVDASSPLPETMHPSTPLYPESTPYTKDTAGVTLDAAFRWRDVPAPPRAPEVSAEGLREAQKLTALTLKIDLAETGQMRAELGGSAFLLPAHSELRARSDHYGNLLVWPNAAGYRVLPPGALRAVLSERRIDVTPLSPGTLRAQGEGRRLGVGVRKIELGSSIATVRLELGKVPEGGEGGALLCRALVELGGVDPRTPACQPGEVPLAAAYAWQEGGGISFEVTVLAKRADLNASALLVPPPNLAHLPSGLPGVAQGIFLGHEALAALRSAPLSLAPERDPSVPREGFVGVNHSDRLMYLLLDGVPVVAIPPFAEQYVIGPQRGRYVAQWRTFLGERVTPPQSTEMPARLHYSGSPDAGAPDGG
jgi:hypothetical protein